MEAKQPEIGLKRSLRLWDLILYGLIVIQPTAPMPLFGVLSSRGHGHAVTAILLAMIAMLFTAISYGRMARVYPSAGSAFTYVGQEINPALGYVTGWSMAMDYMLNPVLCIIWCSKAAMNFAPGSHYWMWVVFFFALFTGLNLRGIKTSARVNEGLAAGMSIRFARRMAKTERTRLAPTNAPAVVAKLRARDAPFGRCTVREK